MAEPTVALGMIVKDEYEQVAAMLTIADQFFDAIYLTVSDKKTANKLKKFVPIEGGAEVHVDYRPWNNRFDEARNHNLDLIRNQGYSYYMWLDADDEFDFLTVPKLVELAEEGPYDAIWLPYEYAHDENGVCVALHWRERLLRADKGFEWRGWVHENCITDEPIKSKRANVPVIHRSDHKEESEARNHAILTEAYQATEDPRYIHYLGISLFGMGKWEECIDVLKHYVSVGGWDEEIYRSLLRMSEASTQLGKDEDAMQYALRAAGLMPDYPQAYFNLAQIEFEQGNFKQTLEWLKVGFSKPQPETPSITDPTTSERAMLMGAIAEFKIGNNRNAVEILKQIKMIPVDDILPSFEHEASIDRMVAILPALFKHYDNPEELWNRLKPEIKYDNRFRKIREALTEPKVWPKKSVVFFCGKGYEEWGPHTLDKGMGGSEEAVVYLSRELAFLGYDVHVYGEVSGSGFMDTFNDDPEHQDEPMTNAGGSVTWWPWTHIDKRDTFDTLIIWRYPQFTPQFKANRILVDMHDLLPKKVVKPYKNATYMFKTAWHAEQYPDITNFTVAGNGIVKEQFKGKKSKKLGTVVWTSAYYRGLECLVDMWPKIKEQVPKATLDIYYGWESWVAAEGEDEFYHRMSKKLKDAAKLGVKEHGRVSHEKVAKAMMQSQVWAYPTQFEEIHCITALKAQEAECYPVVTNVAALQETVQCGNKIDTKRIYSDEYSKEKFVKAVVEALKENKSGTPVADCDWSDVAQAWQEAIEND